MLKLLFWNLDKKEMMPEVESLAGDHQAHILIFAEDPMTTVSRLVSLNRNQPNYFITPTACKRIKIYTSFGDRFIASRRESPYFTMREISLPKRQPFLLFALHWKSLMWRNISSQTSALIEMARIIREEEDRCGHRRTIVVGDFNSEPFSEGMTLSNGMHAVMCRQVASREQREISPFGSFPLFYNPSWSLYGDDRSDPPGTYYRTSAEENCQFWHIFDQVLIRPALLPYLPKNSINILTTAGGENLLNKSGFPLASDHLPILFTFDIPTITRS